MKKIPFSRIETYRPPKGRQERVIFDKSGKPIGREMFAPSVGRGHLKSDERTEKPKPHAPPIRR